MKINDSVNLPQAQILLINTAVSAAGKVFSLAAGLVNNFPAVFALSVCLAHHIFAGRAVSDIPAVKSVCVHDLSYRLSALNTLSPLNVIDICATMSV